MWNPIAENKKHGWHVACPGCELNTHLEVVGGSVAKMGVAHELDRGGSTTHFRCEWCENEFAVSFECFNSVFEVHVLHSAHHIAKSRRPDLARQPESQS